MNWFASYRQSWIAEVLQVFGFINREHLVRKFGISMSAASADLQAFQEKHPGKMIYNKTTRRYEAGKESKS